jgi:tetratricopeptide (TPR) repeat protein
MWATGDPADQDLEETYLELMGLTLCEKGDYARAEALRQELQSKLQATSQRGNSSHADLGSISQTLGMGELRVAMGRFDEAREYFEESLQIAHATGYRLVQIRSLNGLGAVALATGEYLEANHHFTTARLACEDALRYREQAIALNGLGETACMTGDYDKSRNHFMAALHILRSISAAPVALASLVGLARLMATLDSPEKSVELLALVIHHPAATRVSREKAESLLAELSLALPSNILTLEGVLNTL